MKVTAHNFFSKVEFKKSINESDKLKRLLKLYLSGFTYQLLSES